MAPPCLIAVAFFVQQQAELLPAIEAAVKSELGCAVELAPGKLRIPDGALDGKRYVTDAFLESLEEINKPDRWSRLIGVVRLPLKTSQFEAVAGVARKNGVGLVTTGDKTDTRELARLLISVVHELAHTYGLKHCEEPACALWAPSEKERAAGDWKDARTQKLCAKHADELKEAIRGPPPLPEAEYGRP